ncbi:hypothetical protein D3C87_1844080 [compost metagenome]
MDLAKECLLQLEGLSEKWFGLPIAALGMQVGAQVAVADRCVRMAFTKHTHRYLQRISKNWFSIFIKALPVHIVSNIVRHCRCDWMNFAVDTFR